MESEIKDRAIVFTTYSVKERSRIVNFFLEKGGELVSVNIFGFNSKKSLFKAILQPMNLVDIYLIKKKNNSKSWNIVDVVLVDSYQLLKQDYNKIESVLKIFKTIEKMPYKQSEVFNRTLYKLVYKFLNFYEKNENINCKIIELYFYYYFIYSLGYNLSVINECISCNQKTFSQDLNQIISLDLDSGYFICNNCRKERLMATNSLIEINYSSFKLLHMFNSLKFESLNTLDNLVLNDNLYNEIKSLYEYYLAYHLNKKIYL